MNQVGIECKYLHIRRVVCVITIRLIVFYFIGHVFYCKNWVRIIISLLYWVSVIVCLRFMVLRCLHLILLCFRFVVLFLYV
jgi:hypothetical protein